MRKIFGLNMGTMMTSGITSRFSFSEQNFGTQEHRIVSIMLILSAASARDDRNKRDELRSGSMNTYLCRPQSPRAPEGARAYFEH
jgi:hypothetical protein